MITSGVRQKSKCFWLYFFIKTIVVSHSFCFKHLYNFHYISSQGFPFENFGGGGQDSPPPLGQVGGGENIHQFSVGRETQFYQFNG